MIHILWEFTDGPWGGGNQFLKALRNQFIKKGIYAEQPEKADVILFNSHQFQKRALQCKLKYPEKVFVHRVDGPILQTRGESGLSIDRKIFYCNSLIADGTIFQSSWSRQESYRQGMKTNRLETSIINAPDPEIFHPGPAERPESDSEKIRLITTTWSSNPRKGFDIYHYLDEHLDFTRFSMTFVGNADAPFRNIETLEPKPSQELAAILRNHDIFIAASTREPCSNSFLEALHCGLPAVARDNSSYPELLDGHGLLFEGKNDIIERIQQLSNNLSHFKATGKLPSMEEVAHRYHTFFMEILKKTQQGEYTPKRLSLPKYYLARILLKNM